MEKRTENEVPKINLFTSKQNMDTPYITEQAEDTETINAAALEVDSDRNEDPNRERLLDDSFDAFMKANSNE